MEINHIPFLDVIDDVTAKFNKIPKKDFINDGGYPIIDQGANIIAGYTNEKSVITDLGYPVIVFGDHTRILKYVNYPFAIGADGVKVLSVDTEKAYPLYVFYFLKFLRIPNAGYSRHYKFLKEKKIALPENIYDQKRIAKILSQCELLIQKRKESIDLLDELLRSTFLEMFGDVLSNSKKYPTKDFVDIVKLKRGFDFPKSERVTGEFPLCASNGIIDYVKDFKVKGPGIITGRSGTIGKVTLVFDNYWPLNTTLYSEEFIGNPIYLKFLLQYFRLERFSNGAGVPTLNRNLFTKAQIIDVPEEEQNIFAQIVIYSEKIKEKYIRSLNELENLNGSISQRAFNGELDLSKVNISDMEDSKKKEDKEVLKEFSMDEKQNAEKKQTKIEDIIAEGNESYFSLNCQLYVNKSTKIRSKIFELNKNNQLENFDLNDDLAELNNLGQNLLTEAKEFTPWQIDRHRFVERYIPLLPDTALIDYPNINIFSRNKFDYASMTLDDYYGIPDDVIADYGSIENTLMDTEFFIKKYFSAKPFTVEDLEPLYNKVVYEQGSWYKYEEMKDFIFKALQGEDALLSQAFEDVEFIDESGKKIIQKRIMLKLKS